MKSFWVCFFLSEVFFVYEKREMENEKTMKNRIKKWKAKKNRAKRVEKQKHL